MMPRTCACCSPEPEQPTDLRSELVSLERQILDLGHVLDVPHHGPEEDRLARIGDMLDDMGMGTARSAPVEIVLAFMRNQVALVADRVRPLVRESRRD
jgi:hypothetical protein